jgi:pimeloyl-ACP methyl ester carboxylesterase
MRFDSINHLLFTVAYRNAGAADLEKQLRNAYARWKVWDDSVVAANKLEYGGHFFFPLETYIRQATGAWYQGFITYDPAKVLPRVHVPWLAINGDKDIISDGAVNLKGIADNLAKGGNRKVTTWLVPGINHLYQHCKTCDLSEYAGLQETMAPEVVTRIAEWIPN